MSSTVIAYHEVNDTEHWLASPKREEFFGPMGVGVRTFVNPDKPTLTAVLIELPDGMSLEDFQAALQTEAAAEAMAHDGVRPETVTTFIER